MKTRIALFLTLMIISASCFSSDKSQHDDYKTFKRVYLGFSVTPAASYRYLHGNFVPAGISQADVQGTIGYSNQHSFPEFGVNATFKVGINLTHWLAIESGVGYSLIRYGFQSDQYFTPDIWNGIHTNGTDSFKTVDKENYQYFTVPVGLRFSIGHRKVRGVIAAGAELDFLVKQKAVYTYTNANGQVQNGVNIQEPHNFNTFNVSPYLGVGIDCHLSRVVVLRIMPQAQIQALKNINTPITEYLWNAGLNISLLFGI